MKFPVIHSTLSGVSLGERLKRKYNLSAHTQCTLLRAAMNHLYVVSDGANTFVFRVYTHGWKSKLEISEELRLLNHLKRNRVPVSFPIPDSSGKLIQEFDAPEGTRFGVLFSYASGEKIAKFSAEASYAIGQALGKMHQSTANFDIERISYGTKTLLDDSLPNIAKRFKNDLPEVRFLHSLADLLTAKFETAAREQLRWGAVHLDIWFDNLHIGENNHITFFDFDFCGNGWLVLDVSYFLFQLLATNLDENDYRAKAEHFLKGYTELSTLNEAERALLPYACLSIMIYYIGIQCDRFDYWTNIFVNEDHLRRMVGNLNRWMAIHHIAH